MHSREHRTPECVDQFLGCPLQTYDSRHDVLALPWPYFLSLGSIRFMANDQNNYREKYNGQHWKLVCTWPDNKCTNFAVSNKLCSRHIIERQNEILSSISWPLYSTTPNTSYQTVNKDNCIKLITEVNQNKTTDVQTNDSVKSEFPHFKRFSIDFNDDEEDDVSCHTVKSELGSSSSSPPKPSTDIEYIGSKSSSNDLNIPDSLSKKIPPLTSFEEIYLGNLLIDKCPRTCSLLDAQLYLHEEAIKVVKNKYQIQMNTISSEYFYDFLLRHPRIAIHYKNWFSSCKSIPPTTACSIDTKIWTLSMIIRGASTTDE